MTTAIGFMGRRQPSTSPVEQWESSGLACRIRTGGLGCLCGYVGVPTGHPLFGVHYDDLTDVDVHGGLTFSSLFEEGEGALWWLGFDTAHADSGYWSHDQVKAETEDLATQIAAYTPERSTGEG